ncbi:MAG: hypothetical protein RMK52_03595 [Chitinophagales bacterium]|nr:hypothetical protein [Chitinophagales bacterium]MDW8393311.1 hypothetical protein [Chitinophagales bacterium]
MRRLTVFLCVFCLACKKEEPYTPQQLSPVPAIELISVNPASVRQLTDTLVFVISYTDGDGDLGDYHADSLSLWITDLRFPLTIRYHIPPLAPAETSIPITGELRAVLSGIILKDEQATSEQAVFTIRLKDRAGHWSNEVFSPPIVILP